MAISHVGTEVNDDTGTDDITVPTPAGTQENDLVIGTYTYNDNNAGPVSGGSFDNNGDDVDDAAGEDTNHSWFWEFAPASPPANYTFSGSDGAPPGTARVAGGIIVLRGVDLVTPFDETYVQGSHYLKQVNSTSPQAQPIDINTAGAWVVILSRTNNATITDMVPPSGYNERDQVINNDRNLIICTREIASPGTETPGVMSHTGIDAADDSTHYTLAIRPATAGPGPGPQTTPLSARALIINP